MVDSDSYLLHLSKYIHLNPCFIANESLDRKLIKFYTQATGLPILGDEAFVNTLPIVELSMEVARREQVIQRPAMFKIISAVALKFGEETKTLTTAKKGRGKSNVPRKMAMYIVRKYDDYRLQEIADMFGLQHYGGVSSTIRLFVQELQNDSELQNTVYCVAQKLGVQILV